MLDGEGVAWIEDTNNLTFTPSVFYFIIEGTNFVQTHE